MGLRVRGGIVTDLTSLCDGLGGGGGGGGEFWGESCRGGGAL